MATMLWLRTPTASRLIIPGVLSSRDNRLLALLWQIKSSERILTAGRLGDLESWRRGGLGRGS